MYAHIYTRPHNMNRYFDEYTEQTPLILRVLQENELQERKRKSFFIYSI